MDFLNDALANVFYYPFYWLTEAANASSECMVTNGNGVISQLSAKLVSAISRFMPCMQGVANAVAVMFFLFALIDCTMSDRLTTEIFMKKFIYLAVAIGIIAITPKFYTTAIDFGDAMTTWVVDHFNITSAKNELSLSDFQDAFDGCFESEEFSLTAIGTYLTGTLKALVFALIGVMLGMIEILCSVVIMAIVYIIAIARVLEMNVRGAMLPIGVAMCSDDGYRGAGGRYIKRFLAVCCQGAALAMIGKIGAFGLGLATANVVDTLTTFSLDNIFENLAILIKSFVFCLSIAVAMVTAMHKSTQLMNDAFGA